ncbi:hypothetical protein PT974_10081 [Cladobotryum mycophilum]|uniref:DUF7924 domain-containing protein n=1 Tax=Cladobotryum mycophilum TaxID=491253 RepID=A0ABR0S9Z0_9HYPO
MSSLQGNPSSLGKRPTPSHPDLGEGGPSHPLHPRKKQKTKNSDLPSPGFWDNLSKIFLEEDALRELNRRNTSGSLGHQNKPLSHVACNFGPSADEILAASSPTALNVIRQSARVGGPDVQDLRGYCIFVRRPVGTVFNQSKAKDGKPEPRLSRLGSSPISVIEEYAEEYAETYGEKNAEEDSEECTEKYTEEYSEENTEKYADEDSEMRANGPYGGNFRQRLEDNGIFPDGHQNPESSSPTEPKNIDDILLALSKPRGSLKRSRFSSDDFREFKRANTSARREADVLVDVIPIISGERGGLQYRARDILFNNLDRMTDCKVPATQPDVYYGASPGQLDPNIRKELSTSVIPSSQLNLPLAPNFFLEVKGPKGTPEVAENQAIHNGATGARGIHALQAYKQEETQYDKKSYTITSTYQDGVLKMYASHPLPPSKPGEKRRYVTTQLNSWSLTGNVNTFREAASAYRNGRDWAKQQRDGMIRQANARESGEDHDLFDKKLARDVVDTADEEAIEYVSSDAKLKESLDMIFGIKPLAKPGRSEAKLRRALSTGSLTRGGHDSRVPQMSNDRIATVATVLLAISLCFWYWLCA